MRLTTVLLPVLAALANTATATPNTTSQTSSATTTTSSTSSSMTTVATTTTKSSSTSTSSTTASAVNIYSACAAQPSGISLAPTVDTDTAFLTFAPFISASNAAALLPPTNFLTAFYNLQASVTQYDSYITYHYLSFYDVTSCANYCTNTYGCVSFNIFFERSPSLNPAAGCPNPASITLVKCALFGQTVSSSGIATNAGQYRDQFHVVIAGSNAYNKLF